MLGLLLGFGRWHLLGPPTPTFVAELVISEDPPAADLGELLVDNMRWCIEWPHVDTTLARVFLTLPGHYRPELLAECQLDDDGDTLVSSAAGQTSFFR